ncbi:MAG: succinate dehydrogenase, hydrophobic membrane anchor protein [Hyphomicrobiaceae bacterium]|nr:succinate dehydrogenase, hydrophobic membrane anchor protein [Hyphomicrobiaceae bacterium]
MSSRSAMRTPLKNARRLGSAKEGADHFWLQRVTAMANVFLVTFLIALLVGLAGADYTHVRASLSSPIIAVPLLLLITSGLIHMRLGMQVIIEDYVTNELGKVLALMANTFFTILVGTASVWAVLKLSFGG